MPTIVWKEIRALLPVWAAAMAIAVSVLLLPDDRSQSGWWWAGFLVSRLAPYVFMLTPVALGAFAMGHEFSHRTWPMLLSQPMTRSRLLAVRMSVLVAMIGSVTVCSGLALRHADARAWARYSAMVVEEGTFPPEVIIPLIGGLLVAPWITLVARSAIAGMIAVLVGPGLLYAGSLILARLVYGPLTSADRAVSAAASAFTQASWRWGMVCLAAVAGWGLWHSFLRAEAVERTSATINAWRFRRVTLSDWVSRRGTVIGSLVAKELRLQVPTFAVAGLFAIVWGVSLSVPDRLPSLFSTYQVLFGMLLALLAGSVATAEERQFGTIASQLLLPQAAWRQWTVKLVVVFGVVAALSVGLNLLLGAASPEDIRSHLRLAFRGEVPELLGALALVTTVAFYVSSFTSGGLRALVLAGAGGVAMIYMVQTAAVLIRAFLFETGLFSTLRATRANLELITRLQIAIVVVTALIALGYAFRNHRFSDIGPRRIGAQVATMYVWLVGSLVIAQVVVARAWP
jgi:hypothetical protein